MPEEIQEQPQHFDVDRKLDLIRRRHLQFLIPLLLGWMLVWSASWIIAPRYKSTTTILVQQPSVAGDVVNIGDDMARRLESITEQMMSRTRLLTIIGKLHLYESAARTPNPDEQVTRMRKDISIDLVRDPGTNKINSFKVSYTAASPEIAQRVTSELTGLFINYNRLQLEHESQDTTTFMEKQLEDARTALAQQEARVRQFQSAHEGELPSQQQSNIQILNGLQAQLQQEQDALNTAKQQRVYLQSLIQQYRAAEPVEVKPAAGPGAELAALDTQLQKMRADLTDLRGRYTDQHPAVISLKAAIAQTQKQREDLAAQIKSSSAGPGGLGTDQGAVLLQLQSQQQANQIEIANREEGVKNLQSRINEYQGRLNAEPAAEQQLADLTRGYEQSQKNYDDLLKKKNDSSLATSMEQMQELDRFSVLDPPSLPVKPDFPNRIKFCAMGLAFGIALGAAVVALLEFLDDRLHSEQQIEDMLSAPILAEVPEILRTSDERRQRHRAILGWTVAVVVFLVIVAGSAFSYLHA
jgi:succinoglycan biosynthesis transport protein ExoP